MTMMQGTPATNRADSCGARLALLAPASQGRVPVPPDARPDLFRRAA